MSRRRTAVVTGAASGIGLALASLLGDRGDRLCLFDIDGDALGRVAELGADVVFEGDVADPSSVEQFADVVGTADLLCLNAGVLSTWMGRPWEAPHKEWNRVLAVNVVGVVNGLRSFLPRMLASNDRRNVLITASLAGAATWPGGGPYAASKHAVLALAEQVALELADTNVGVTTICPALVRTAMSEHGEDPEGVAVEALQAVSDRRFAVVPSEWSTAVTDRASRLASGAQPILPEPIQ